MIKNIPSVDRVAVTMLGRVAFVYNFPEVLVDLERPGGSIGLRFPLDEVRPTTDEPGAVE